MLRQLLCMLLLLLLLSPGFAAAEILEGKIVSTTNFHQAAPDVTTINGPAIVTVGPGVELLNFAGIVDVDFSNTGILVTATRNMRPSFLEVVQFSTEGVVTFTEVTIDPATNYVGFDESRIDFEADSIDLNLTGLPGLAGQQIVLVVVPEPATSSLLLAGIALLAACGCRRSAGRPDRSRRGDGC